MGDLRLREGSSKTTRYEGIDPLTESALGRGEADIRSAAAGRVTVHADAEVMKQTMADRLLADYQSALSSGRGRCLMIVPVGPVGQYDLLAQACVRDGISLDRLTLIVMDEYLAADNCWISSDDALSFRGHIQRHLLDKLPDQLRPRVVVPDPDDLGAVPKLADDNGGIDLTYAGVGITGHLAFNDPVPGRDDPDWFASLPTRIVSLLPETRLINAVTAASGNTLRIPFLAVTVGMKEILSAKTLRIWMNRAWQCAAVRRMLFGPVTGAFPASLIQRHEDVSIDITEEVLGSPEPTLR